MKLISKEFQSLSLKELYEIYKLRAEVFVVEQNCVYQDVDDKDLSAIHILLLDEIQQLIGYSRIVAPGLSYKEPSIGRVLIKKDFRRSNLGEKLMKYSINKSLELFKGQGITISAQSYLENFYNELGFESVGETYLEDGIPHIKMHYPQP